MATDGEKKVENLGKRLKELRDEQGLTQEEVANAIGVEAGAYSNYERETRTPRCSKADGIGRFLQSHHRLPLRPDDASDWGQSHGYVWR